MIPFHLIFHDLNMKITSGGGRKMYGCILTEVTKHRNNHRKKFTRKNKTAVLLE